jgi:hypothetical protein
MVKRLQPNCDADGPVSFATLMALEQVGNNTYRSLTAAFEPAGGLFDRLEHVPPRAYGGFVYAQAVWAAAQTMIAGEQEWVVHVRDTAMRALERSEKKTRGTPLPCAKMQP